MAERILAVIWELGLDEERMNVEGGVIAHRRPIGATDALLTTRLRDAMPRDGIGRDIVTPCIGAARASPLPWNRSLKRRAEQP